jgi:hypothetical protein
LVIDQNPEHQSRFAIDVLLHHFGYTDQTWLAKPYRSNIAFKLHKVENMTEFTTPQPTRKSTFDEKHQGWNCALSASRGRTSSMGEMWPLSACRQGFLK